MSIKKQPPLKRGSEAALDAFINRAPDAGTQGNAAPVEADAASPRATKQAKQAISLTLNPALLARIDEQAQRLSLSRAAAISLACTRWLDQEGR